MSEEEKLAKLREQIDVIDLELTKLLNERARLALQAGIIKGWENIQRPEREAQVLANVVAANNKGPLSNDGLSEIFRTIVRVCRTIQYSK